MLFNQKEPCAECPFRVTSARGWLGPDTGNPEQVLQKVHGEGGYACHMDVTKKLGIYGGPTLPASQAEHCVGALIHATQGCKVYRDREAAEAQERLEESCTTPVLNWHEFMRHHDMQGIAAAFSEKKEKAVKTPKRKSPKEKCHLCGKQVAKKTLSRHMLRMHGPKSKVKRK